MIGNGCGRSTSIVSLNIVRTRPSINVANIELIEKRRLDVDLRELGLAIGAKVLVAEAFDDLIVAVEARHHQHLLEQLRRLRQRVELSVVDA